MNDLERKNIILCQELQEIRLKIDFSKTETMIYVSSDSIYFESLKIQHADLVTTKYFKYLSIWVTYTNIAQHRLH